MSTWLPHLKITVAIVLLMVGFVYLDIRSVALEIRRNRLGTGSSGVPLVAVFFYAMAVWLLPVSVLGLHKGYLFLSLLLFHLVCHFIIPRRVKHQNSKPDSDKNAQ